MYPVLILREEAVCLILLIFMLLTARSYHMGKDNRAFRRLTLFAIAHVTFDIVTVLTVNASDRVPVWLNDGCHVLFFMAAILFSNELCMYVLRMCYPGSPKKIYAVGLVLSALYLCALPFLDIEYVEKGGTWLSTGPAVFVGFAIAYVYFGVALLLTFLNFKKLSRPVKAALLPMMLLLIVGATAQIVFPYLLATGAGLTIVTIAFFFSLENPTHVFESKVMTDALTGLRSRHKYDQDIAVIDRKFRDKPTSDYIFAFCDINGLRAVNGLFGHHVGDKYITIVATILAENFKHADGIYRMGGDEFVVMFHGVPEDTVIEECQKVQETCANYDTGYDYTAQVAIGYAVSGAGYKNIRDVLRTADYMMYRNKAEIKRQKAFVVGSTGTRVNLTGLTDNIFNAMCTSNERMYPFVQNIDTGVTRVSPVWQEYFGLPDEFMANFCDYWMQYIHPDDRQNYYNDFSAVLDGKKQYHNVEYRVKNKTGEYVFVSCHGAVYHGKNGEPDIFAGYMVNHGVQETIDTVTGLRNYVIIDEIVTQVTKNNELATVLKLGINNISRVNMLYGYARGNLILKETAQVIKREVGSLGEVFCQDGVNFSVVFRGASRQQVLTIFGNIKTALERGVLMEDSLIPMSIAGGAVEIQPGSGFTHKVIRSNLLYALEESKFNARGRLVFHDELDKVPATQDVTILREIHTDAVADMRFFRMRYQPIVHTKTGRLIGAEALLRWVHPDYGEVSPAKFIGFLEGDPCFYQLGLHIIEQAITDAQIVRMLMPDFSVNVNITSIQLQNPSFVPDVLVILKKHDYPISGIMFELTERCKELDGDFLNTRIAEMRKLGMRVAFDDMGTGYSTINLLLNIAVDEIKLDIDFVRGLEKNANYKVFVSALMQGVEKNKFTVCFEGVENESVLALLRSFGESLCQGYHFSKPVFLPELRAFVEENLRTAAEESASGNGKKKK